MSGLVAFAGRVWREAMRDLLEDVSPEDPGLGARSVVASGPPIGVTWRHPYKVSPETLEFWRADGERNPIFVRPEEYERTVEAMRIALVRPRDEEALALQLRMAERFPAP